MNKLNMYSEELSHNVNNYITGFFGFYEITIHSNLGCLPIKDSSIETSRSDR